MSFRKKLTEKQHAVLGFIKRRKEESGVFPIYREVMEHFGYASPNSVTQHFKALHRKGYLRRSEELGFYIPGEEHVTIGVYRDDSLPAFAAWRAGSMKDDPVILFNVHAHIRSLDEDFLEGAVQTLMHEFGHALEEYFDLEFSEERVQQIAAEYQGEEYDDQMPTEDERQAALTLVGMCFREENLTKERFLELASNCGFKA